MTPEEEAQKAVEAEGHSPDATREYYSQSPEMLKTDFDSLVQYQPGLTSRIEHVQGIIAEEAITGTPSAQGQKLISSFESIDSLEDILQWYLQAQIRLSITLNTMLEILLGKQQVVPALEIEEEEFHTQEAPVEERVAA